MLEKIIIGTTSEETIRLAAEEFIRLGQEAISLRGKFTVALSGGSTPKEVYKELAKHHQKSLSWDKVFLFFSDERCVAPTSEDSNYKMAMENGFSSLPIPKSHIFRMEGENNPQKGAKEYEELVKKHVADDSFDLVILGMGNDGHTASLFPATNALRNKEDLVVSNVVPQLKTTRITFTFKLINQAKRINIYILGSSKASLVKELFTKEDKYPIQKVDFSKTTFFFDDASAHLL